MGNATGRRLTPTGGSTVRVRAGVIAPARRALQYPAHGVVYPARAGGGNIQLAPFLTQLQEVVIAANVGFLYNVIITNGC